MQYHHHPLLRRVQDLTPSVYVRFWSKVLKTDNCWNWTGCKTRGYGKLQLWKNKTRQLSSAHRISWIIHFGDIPDGLFVLHSCDNASCVNPDHLFLGTALDNARDRSLKGRSAIGERGGNNKWSVSVVRRIRSMRDQGLSSISRITGVPETTVGHILSGRTWKNLE